MISKNLKYLRQKNKISQQVLAEAMGVARTTLGDYERGKTEPNIDMLIKLADYFDVQIDELIRSNISYQDYEVLRNKDMRVLAITVDNEKRGNIELVDTKAEAGYLESFADPEYIRDLPKISFPNIPEGTFRGFEIQGDSMLPMESGSVVICRYLESLDEIKNNKTYVIVSRRDGLVYKRIRKDSQNNRLVLLSDNEIFLPYEMKYNEINEIWQYFAHLSFSDSRTTFDFMLEEKINDIQKKVTFIRDEMKQGKQK